MIHLFLSKKNTTYQQMIERNGDIVLKSCKSAKATFERNSIWYVEIEFPKSELLGMDISEESVFKVDLNFEKGQLFRIVDFKENGISSAVISLGGNVQTLNGKPDGSDWRVAIENPADTGSYIGVLSIKDKAVITSGGYERYFKQDGKTYHHIIDPATGYPANNGLTSVTIVSDDGTLADGLSTSLFIMGPEKAQKYWKEHSDEFDTILVKDDGSILVSEGLAEYFTSESDFTIIKK